MSGNTRGRVSPARRLCTLALTGVGAGRSGAASRRTAAGGGRGGRGSGGTAGAVGRTTATAGLTRLGVAVAKGVGGGRADSVSGTSLGSGTVFITTGAGRRGARGTGPPREVAGAAFNAGRGRHRAFAP